MLVTTTLAVFLFDLLAFFLKAAIIVIAIIMVLAFAMKERSEDRLNIKDLNKRFKSYRRALLGALLDKKALKKMSKKEAATEKEEAKAAPRPITYHLSFKGDMKASAVEDLRESITAILTTVEVTDEVVVSLESPGGMVHSYGLAASQLQRIKDAKIPLVICVDKVAASGGYMMACLADKIIAAPFAVIGSVGVVASIPNFNRILKKNDVDYFQITSGKFKRTVSVLGEVTDEGLDKFKEEIEQTHVLFKDHVRRFRPQVDVEKISTGEHWYGLTAIDLKLVDELGTSDDYLYRQSQNRRVKDVSFQQKKTLKHKIAEGFSLSIERGFDAVLEKLNRL